MALQSIAQSHLSESGRPKRRVVNVTHKQGDHLTDDAITSNLSTVLRPQQIQQKALLLVLDLTRPG